MQEGNKREALKTLVEFQASSGVSLSLSADGCWLAYGDGSSGSLFIGRWKNRSPHLSNVTEIPVLKAANLQFLEWSPNSKYLLAVSNAIAYLVKPDNARDELAFTELEEVGIGASFWSYDSTFVIVNDLCSSVTAIFLTDGSVHWLPGVRMANSRPLFALRPDCKALALWAYHANGGECLMVYSSEDWSLTMTIRPNCVLVAGVSWFPNSSVLFVWDSVARHCMEFFHPDGSFKHTIIPADVTEEGIRTVAVSPCSSLVAIFNENFKVIVYNSLIWRLVSLFDIRKYFKTSVPCHWIPFIHWSTCCQFLAFSSSASSHLTIWSKQNDDSFVFSFDNEGSISDLAWHPKKPVLAVATGSQQIYLVKCPKPGFQLATESCTLQSTIPVENLRWVGANSTFLLNRSQSNHAAVTCIR